MLLDELLGRLEGVRKVSGGYLALCPAHDDHTPSLSITESDGKILMHCLAGCPTQAVMDALGLTTADLRTEPRANGNGQARTIAATYDYQTPDGAVVYQVVRYVPKTFRQRRPDGAGGWIWNLQGTPRVLYHLPAVLAAVAAGETIYLVEGERDADALTARGLTATTCPGGAGKWRPTYSDLLRGADVVILPDNDEPGRAHAQEVVTSLRAAGNQRCLVLELPNLPPKGDVSDWLASGGSADALEELVEQARRADKTDEPKSVSESIFLDWPAFWARETDETDWAYPDVLARGRGHAIYARHKDGKSLLALYLSATMATGPDPLVVVYLDYEMSEADVRERLESMGYGPESDLSRLRYALLPSLPPLDSREGAAALMEILTDVQGQWPEHHQVVVIDTIGRAVTGDENDADTFRAFYTHTGSALKRRGATWVRLDHAGKDEEKGQRGSSSKGDDVDVVWKLIKTENGVTLLRDFSRISWVPERVRFSMSSEEPLAYNRVVDDWPVGTSETAAALERLDVPLDAPMRTAEKALRGAGEGRRRAVVIAALRWRNQRREMAI